MNYKITFAEMSKLALEAQKNKRGVTFTLEEMREQVARVKANSTSTNKKQAVKNTDK